MSSLPHRGVVALTGVIGSGKSTVARLFAEFGARVISADELARRAVCKGSKGLEKIKETLGEELIETAGELDRKKLGEIVFNDPVLRNELEKITHPIIRELAEEEFNRALAEGAQLIIYDCPLFFEAGLDELGFKAVVVVSAPEEECLRRIMRRDGLNKTEAKKRMQAQLSLAEKTRRATYVLDNSGSIVDLKRQVEELVAKIVKSS